jgi:copper(I)-binding protein
VGLFVAAIALALLATGGPALAVEVTAGSLALSGFWTTATPPGAPTAAGYLTITNGGKDADRLLAVSSPLAAAAMLHEMEVAGGIASMRMVAGVEIPPGKTVTFAPSTFHIMFVTMKQPLKAGDSLPVTLTFAKAGRVDALLPVLAIGAKGPAAP